MATQIHEEQQQSLPQEEQHDADAPMTRDDANQNPAAWREEPITEGQIETLWSMIDERFENRDDFELPATKGEASDWITELKTRESRLPATPEQMKRLLELKDALGKTDDVSGFTRSRAGRVINGWTLTLERRQNSPQYQARLAIDELYARKSEPNGDPQAQVERLKAELAEAEAAAKAIEQPEDGE